MQVLYTSGTTDEPKGVVHRHRHICANLDPIAQEIDRYKKWARPFQPIRILNLLPLSHMFGQSLGIFVPLLLDASATFMNGLHPGEIRRAIRGQRISVLVCVPRILESLKADVERRHPDTRTESGRQGGPLRRWWRHRDVHRDFGFKFWAFVVGGAMLSAETEAFWSRVGLLVVQGYGLTETSPVVSLNHPFRARRGTLGEVIGGQEVRIAADGEILVRGPSVVGEYLEAGTRRVAAVDEDGWLHTGDVGKMDREGRLVFQGRKKDVIVTADGLNAHPSDIERALRKDAEVRDAVVVALGPSGSERIHAALILHQSGSDRAAIVKRVNRRLEPHQRIQSSSEWPEDEFPRTASTFKTQRRKVSQRLSAADPAPSEAGVGGLDGILQALTRRAPEDLTDGLRLDEDLALSSLERIDMLASLEEHHSVQLDEADLAGLATVGDLRQWVARHSGRPVADGDGDPTETAPTPHGCEGGPPAASAMDPARTVRFAQGRVPAGPAASARPALHSAIRDRTRALGTGRGAGHLRRQPFQSPRYRRADRGATGSVAVAPGTGRATGVLLSARTVQLVLEWSSQSALVRSGLRPVQRLSPVAGIRPGPGCAPLYRGAGRGGLLSPGLSRGQANTRRQAPEIPARAWA